MTYWVLVLGACLNGECEPIMDVDKEIERLNYTSEYTCNVAGFMLNILAAKQIARPKEAEYRCFEVDK